MCNRQQCLSYGQGIREDQELSAVSSLGDFQLRLVRNVNVYKLNEMSGIET